MKKRTLFYILLLFVFSNGAAAHEGGHYHSETALSIWKLTNGQTIKGNFSFVKNDSLYLEQNEGKRIAVPIQLLSTADKENIVLKGLTLKKLNQTKGEETVSSLSLLQWLYLLAGITVLIGLCLMVIKWKPLIGIALLLIGIIFTSFGFQTTYLNGLLKTDISFLETAFAPYKKHVKTGYDKDYFYVESNGLPQHNMMIGISNWQQQIPLPQNYTGNNHWSIPLQPVLAKEILSTKNNFMRGAIAIAVNGVPIFNALNNRGEDSYLIGELDQWGGHCGKGDDYHYHVAPLSLQTTSGLLPIAFALDGFAIYGEKEPDGTPMKPLDDSHGHADDKSSYHYHGTKDYPYTIGAMRGAVKTDTNSNTENQIIPQAFASPMRPPLKPLRGAKITGFRNTGENSNQLIYELNGQLGYVNYYWDNQNHFTIEQISPEGEKTTNTYERKDRKPKH